MFFRTKIVKNTPLPQLVVLEAWKRLGLGRLLEKVGLNQSQIAIAQLLVGGRLIEPSSELALVDWTERTALPELLGVRVTKSTKDRLYHTGDALFGHRKAIEGVCAEGKLIFLVHRAASCSTT